MDLIKIITPLWVITYGGVGHKSGLEELQMLTGTTDKAQYTNWRHRGPAESASVGAPEEGRPLQKSIPHYRRPTIVLLNYERATNKAAPWRGLRTRDCTVSCDEVLPNGRWSRDGQ